MKIAYLDCVAGISGDMFLGALIDAGLSEKDLKQDLACLDLDEFEINIYSVLKNGFRATKVDVLIDYDGKPLTSTAARVGLKDKMASSTQDASSRGQRLRDQKYHEPDGHHHEPDGHHHEPDGHHHEPDGHHHEPDGHHHEPDGHHHEPDGHHHEPDGHHHEPDGHHHEPHGHHHGPHGHHHHGPSRQLNEILELLEKTSLANETKQLCKRILRRIGAAEAEIHGQEIDTVHLHEVGGVDAIVDVVGVVCGLNRLGIDRLVCSPLPFARGFVDGAHGKIPLPAPASLKILKHAPFYGVNLDRELVTPTGAALVAELASGFGPLPPMIIGKVGYGAGTQDLSIPNVVRLHIGEEEGYAKWMTERICILETTIDDDTGEAIGYVCARCIEMGARDAYSRPVQMKKGRPGWEISVLADEAKRASLLELLFNETKTLGVREGTVLRHSLHRRIRVVETDWGEVKVKIAYPPSGELRYTPEYEDCARLARNTGVELSKVYQSALVRAAAIVEKER